MLIWDIETGPLTLDEIKAVADPFTPPEKPGEFDPNAVKLGNLKNPDKIAEKIAEARTEHAAAVAGYDADCQTKEAKYWAEVVEKAALSAATGRVQAIGCWSATTGKTVIIGDPPGEASETDVLNKFWDLYKSMRKQQRKMVGTNIFGFDLPFLIRRSWVNGVTVPNTVVDMANPAPWKWDPVFFDIRNTWLLGQRSDGCKSSLDHMARVFACGSKADAAGCDGATFHKLWTSDDAEQVALARAYLCNDLQMTRNVAARMGIV